MGKGGPFLVDCFSPRPRLCVHEIGLGMGWGGLEKREVIFMVDRGKGDGKSIGRIIESMNGWVGEIPYPISSVMVS